jgi:hydrogenase large subunit
MHIMGTLAGHWPHTLGLQPGGTTHAIDRAEQARVLAALASFRRFLETRMFGEALESVVAIKSAAELRDWASRPGPATSDLAAFLRLAKALRLDELGRATDRFLSYGAYRQDGGHLFRRGVHAEGKDHALNLADISEDLASSWYARASGPRHPAHGVTTPDADAKGGYSWCKAPRLAGDVVEVGALARQLVDGHPLFRDLVKATGGNVANRVIARLVEIARVALAIEDWTRHIVPQEPFFVDGEMPAEAECAGLIEAARGSLGHWVTVKKGRILNYQIVAPTTWNFSPRDSSGVPGACEQALVGAPVRDGEADPVAVQHIVRSFDPCMVCTVH